MELAERRRDYFFRNVGGANGVLSELHARWFLSPRTSYDPMDSH